MSAALNKISVKQPRVATLQDFSCFGRCSLTVALPVISAAGVEVCAIPTEILSAHTGGLGEPERFSLGDEPLKIIEHWQSLGLSFDVIYTGYLANARQVELAEGLADAFCPNGALLAADPAMADHGKLYGGIDESVVSGMKRLCARADVIMPNLTEAALLTGTPYDPSPDEGAIARLMDALLALGAKSVIITGVSRERGRIGAAVRAAGATETEYIETEKIEGAYHGSGDLFASVAVSSLAREAGRFGGLDNRRRAASVSALIRGGEIVKAARAAVDFTAECLKLTLEAGGDEREGVRFEPLLHTLTEMLG